MEQPTNEDIRKQFQEGLEEWRKYVRENPGRAENIKGFIDNESFRKLVGLGQQIFPFIMNELEKGLYHCSGGGLWSLQAPCIVQPDRVRDIGLLHLVVTLTGVEIPQDRKGDIRKTNEFLYTHLGSLAQAKGKIR
jgi:hypothetical protein